MKVRRGIAFLIALLLCVNLLAVPIAYALDGGEPEQTEGGASPTTENTERGEASEPDGIETITVEIGEPSSDPKEDDPKETDRPEATPAGEASPAASSASETPEPTDEPDPTAIPSDEANEPTPAPTEKPSENPTAEPTAAPSEKPASDPKADVENEADWARMFPQDKLTGVWADDLLALAKSQRGYRESAKNYIEENGEKKGYTRYGAWNKTPYADWNALFVAFCLRYAGVPEEKLPTAATVEAYLAALEGKPLFVSAKNLKDCVPVPGDLVFLRTEPDGECDRMGIVCEVNRDESGAILSLTAIEGDVDGSVQTQSYRFGVKWIAGLAALPAQPTQEPVATSEPTAAPTQEPVATPEPTAAPSTTPEPTAVPMSTKPFAWKKTVGDVVVSVKAEAGAFPIGATLWVERVEAPHVDAAVDEAREGDRNVAVSYTFDIKILDAFGNELQPAEGKKVKVSFSLAEVANRNLETQVYHIEEQGSELTASALEVETAGETATVETDGFSYYTVEFTYGDYTYIMDGDSTEPLSNILDYVGLSGTVTAVETSDDSLFSAEQIDGEWYITAHNAFSTDEWMKVVIEGVDFNIGMEILFFVTDDFVSPGSGGTTFAKAADIATVYIDFEKVKNTNLRMTAATGNLSISGNQVVANNLTLNYASKKNIGSFTATYDDAAVDSAGNRYPLVITLSDITAYTQQYEYSNGNLGAALSASDSFTVNLTFSASANVVPTYDVKFTSSWGVTDPYRIGIDADLTVSVPGIANAAHTFFFTLNSFSSNRETSGFKALFDGGGGAATGHYAFNESILFYGDSTVYFDDNFRPHKNYNGTNRILSDDSHRGADGHDELAVLASATGISGNVWQTCNMNFYLMPDNITYTITSSSGYYGMIETTRDKTASLHNAVGNTNWLYGGRKGVDIRTGTTANEPRTYDVPCGNPVTYKMYPEEGYILHKLKVNGVETTPTATVYNTDGTVKYYTYTFPGTIGPNQNQTIHVTWQPSVRLAFEKKWDDLDNKFGLRPETVKITLSPWPSDGKDHHCDSNWNVLKTQSGETITDDFYLLTAADGWKHAYVDLPMYENYDPDNGTGDLIEYKITEEMQGATASYYTEILPHIITKTDEKKAVEYYANGTDLNHWYFDESGTRYVTEGLVKQRTIEYKILNRLERGVLVIEKDSIPDDAAEAFEYTVKIKPPAGGTVNDSTWTEDSGRWTKTVTISKGDKLSDAIVLPKGTEYQVTEIEKDGWKLLESSGVSGTILTDVDPNMYALENNGAVSGLRIKTGSRYVDETGAESILPQDIPAPLAPYHYKSLGFAPTPEHCFDRTGIEIVSTDNGWKYRCDGTSVEPGGLNGGRETWKVAMTSPSAPKGQYLVYESGNPAKASDTIVGVLANRARFTNLKTVKLTVVKQVEGNQASRDKYFAFTVTFKFDPSKYDGNKDFKDEAAPLSTAVQAMLNAWTAKLNTDYMTKRPTQNAATSYTASEMAVANGYDADSNASNGQQIRFSGTTPQTVSLTLYLQHGDSAVFEDLPYGIEYTVTETPEDYRPRVDSIDGDDWDDEGNGGGEAIPYGFDSSGVGDSFLREDTTVTFVNTRKGAIPVGIFTGVGPAVASVGTAFGLLAVRCLPRKRKRHARRR